MLRVPDFGWHLGPTGPTKALWAYPEKFVTEPHTHNTPSIMYSFIKKMRKLRLMYFLDFLDIINKSFGTRH